MSSKCQMIEGEMRLVEWGGRGIHGWSKCKKVHVGCHVKSINFLNKLHYTIKTREKSLTL